MTIVHSLRSHNRSRLMHLLLERGTLSRSEIAFELGLSKVTSTAIVGELLEGGWLREPGKTEGMAGRPAGLVTLHPQAGTVLGLDVQPEGISLLRGTLTTAEGEKSECQSLERPQDCTDSVLALLERETLQATHGPLRQVVLALPAPVDLGGWPTHPSRLPELEPARLFGWASARGVDLAVENDIKLAALAEFERGAARECQNFALLVEREGGVGLGLFLEGRLYRGSHGLAGELSLVGWPSGAQIHPLESLPLESLPLENLPLEQREWALAQVCAALAMVLDLSRFLIHQSVGGAAALDVTSRIAELVLRPLEVVQSAFGDAGPVHGALLQAARLAQNRLFGFDAQP